MAEYGFDLIQEWETVTYRRLWVLVQGLPTDSAVWRQSAWTRQEEFLAGLLEMSDIASRRVVRALGSKVEGKPLQIERPKPEAKPQEKTMETDTQKIAQWFAVH